MRSWLVIGAALVGVTMGGFALWSGLAPTPPLLDGEWTQTGPLDRDGSLPTPAWPLGQHFSIVGEVATVAGVAQRLALAEDDGEWALLIPSADGADRYFRILDLTTGRMLILVADRQYVFARTSGK